MKLNPFSLVLTAALLAFPLLADDGAYVVIERTYYEQCKNTFESQCNYLYEQVGALFRGWSDELGVIQHQNNGYIHTISLAILQIDSARSDLDLTDPDQVEADTHLQGARNNLISLDDNISRNNDLISQWSHELLDAKTDLQNHVIATSNSFPYIVSTTNLNIYIIVTNSFEAATNNYCCCTNEFEHFLNYYQDVESQVLDQYRATVTNLLDWSGNSEWMRYISWSSPSAIANWFSGGRNMYNFAFGAIPWLNTSVSQYFGGAPLSTGNWISYAQTLSLDAGYPEQLYFMLQGIHDSVEYSARDSARNYQLLTMASTNTVDSVPYSTSTADKNKYQAMIEFLTAPDGYTNQVSAIAHKRNWYQRIEHWLSAITRNTAEKGPPEYPDEQTSGKQDMVDTATNDFNNASSSILGHLERSCVVTNSANLINTCVDNFGACLAHFKWQSSDSARGGTRAGGTGFSRLDFMDATWIEERLIDLSPTGEGPRQMPETITLQDPEHGPHLFSSIVRVLDWTHNIFGLFWICLTFFMVVTFFIFIAKGLIWVWWQGLKFFPTVQRYILGG